MENQVYFEDTYLHGESKLGEDRWWESNRPLPIPSVVYCPMPSATTDLGRNIGTGPGPGLGSISGTGTSTHSGFILVQVHILVLVLVLILVLLVPLLVQVQILVPMSLFLIVKIHPLSSLNQLRSQVLQSL